MLRGMRYSVCGIRDAVCGIRYAGYRRRGVRALWIASGRAGEWYSGTVVAVAGLVGWGVGDKLRREPSGFYTRPPNARKAISLLPLLAVSGACQLVRDATFEGNVTRDA